MLWQLSLQVLKKYKLVAGNKQAVDVFYEKLGEPKERSPIRVTAHYDYWVYLDHHPVINNKKERDKWNKKRVVKYLQDNGGVAADWIKDGEFTDIFYYTREPHYTRTSSKTGPYHFKGKHTFAIDFLVRMEEDNECSLTRGRIRQQVGWTCGPTTIVKVMQTLLTLHHKRNCLFDGPRWRERLERDGWNRLGTAVCSPRVLEAAMDTFVVWDKYYDANDDAILDYCCDTLLSSGMDGKAVKELFQRPPDSAVKVDGNPPEDSFFYWDVNHPVVAAMIQAKIDNGHEDQLKVKAKKRK
jgi:hypothetical protein